MNTKGLYCVGDLVTLEGIKGTIAKIHRGTETAYTIYTAVADMRVTERELIRSK